MKESFSIWSLKHDPCWQPTKLGDNVSIKETGFSLANFIIKEERFLVLAFLSLLITALLTPSVCLAQSHELADQYWEQAQSLSKQGENLKAARMFEKSATAEQESPEPRQVELARQFEKAGYHYGLVGQYDKVMNFSQQALEIYKRIGRESGIATVLGNIGSVYQSQRQHNKALEYFQQSLKILKTQGEEEDIATIFSNIGSVYKSRGQYDKAIEHYKQALEIDRKLGNEAGIVIKLSNIGWIYASRGQYDKAIEHYQQALEIDRRIGNEAGIATILCNIGGVYDSWGQYNKAIEYFQQALEIDRRIGNEAGIATITSNIGGIYDSRGQYDKAIEHYQQALEIDRRIGNEVGIAIRLNNIGFVYSSWGQYDKAIEHYQQALEIHKRLGREAAIASILSNIGFVYETWGQYDKAIKYYKQALEIVQRTGNEAGIAKSLSNIGRVYESWGQYDKAIVFFQQALEINRRIGREAGIAICLSNIGLVYKSWGQYDKAIKQYKQALKIDRRIGNEAGIANRLNNIGVIYESWGQYDKAIEHYQQALEIHKRLGREAAIASILNSIGQIYYFRGQYDKAIKQYKQALEIDRRIGKEVGIASRLNNIGLVYSSWGQYDKAIKHYEQALEIDKRTGNVAGIATTLNNIGMVYKSWGQYDKAIKQYKQALEIDRRIGNEAGIANSLSNIGTIYSYLGQYDKAIEYYRQSIQLKEKIRKTATGDIRLDYLASKIFTYQAIAFTYLKKGDAQGVLDAIEQSRARLLAERISGIESKLELPTLEEVQKGLTKSEAVLLFANINHDNFILMVITDKEIAMEEISKDAFLVKSREEYKKPILMLLERQRGFIKVKKKGERTFAKEKQQKENFETAIHYYRTLLTNPEMQGEARDFGHLLYELLIEPAKEYLTDKTQITIMPDGILGFLPFEALVDKKGNYLAQKYSIGYTQSLTIDKLLQSRDYSKKKDRKSMLAMGGAIYNKLHYDSEVVTSSKHLAWLQNKTSRNIAEKRSVRSSYARLGIGNWSNLPGTLEEVNKLSTIIKDSEIIIGDKVTENKIKQYSNSGKLADYKVLHFATHGLVVPEIPELSAIVLSQFKEEQGGEDGYLRMGEIAKLNLAADFVNLSACETGLGKIYGGEGVVGLTQSFLIAGANGLSVSLWQVADDSTSKLMTELYKKVEETGIGYNQALTEVKRSFINGDYGAKWQSPFYWSPFVYYGK